MNRLIAIVFLMLVAAFAARAWTAQGRRAARDRWALISGFITAVTAFAIVTLPLNMLIVPDAVWFIAIGLLAGGVVGAVLYWPELAWYAGTNPMRRTIRIIAMLCICVLLIGVAVI